jgi:hypothetical protein
MGSVALTGGGVRTSTNQTPNRKSLAARQPTARPKPPTASEPEQPNTAAGATLSLVAGLTSHSSRASGYPRICVPWRKPVHRRT